MPDTLLNTKINLCVSEDCVIQFVYDNNLTVIFPSIEGTRQLWQSYPGNDSKSKYTLWLQEKLSTIQTLLDKYADTLLSAKQPSIEKSLCAVWILQVNVFILQARFNLLD